MNFKKFNGSTWETVRHKRYGSGTDSLTAFPAQIQASGEPLTDYTIYGNTEQNGTPTAEAPVDVVGCGVWDEAHQGYKLPLTVNGTEYPIYLGQVETTRRIKELVLTGAESWMRYNGNYYSSVTDRYSLQNMPCRCTHTAGGIIIDNGSVRLKVFASRFTTVASNLEEWKSYLAAQYTAGTPVTIWYVLATPETGIVNEPLHKIGDYADTITMAQAGVAIPTSDGDNTITFGTTVQPSRMSATFRGWHPVQGAKQYDGSEWR